MGEDARFQGTHGLTLRSRPLFFLFGKILAGEVRPGQVAVAADGAFRQAVEAVEIADSVSTGEWWLVLGFRYLDRAQLAQWQQTDWTGTVLTIPAEPILHPCPCCGFRTLESETRGSYDICAVCGWEDDGVQLDDPDYRGGANAESLNEARAAWIARNPDLHPTSDG